MTAWTEDFESGNSLTLGETASFERTSGSGRGGSFGLIRNAVTDASYEQLYRDDVFTPGPDFLYTGWTKTNTGFTTTGLSGLAIGIPAGGGGAGQSGYQIMLDIRDNNPDVQIRKDSSVNNRATGSVQGVISAEEWVYLEVTWDAGAITANAYADDASGEPGTLIDTVTYNDATYTDGRCGVIGYSLSSYDSLDVTDIASGGSQDTTDPAVAIDAIHGGGHAEGVHEASGYDKATNTLTITGTASD